MDVVLGSQTILDFGNDVGVHDVVVLFIAGVQHGSNENRAVANVIGEQRGLFQAHPVGAHVRLSNGVTVAVQGVLAIVGDGDGTAGTLGDHLSQHFGGLAVHFFGLKNVGEFDFDVEILGRSLGAAEGDHGQSHSTNEEQCEKLFHMMYPLNYICRRNSRSEGPLRSDDSAGQHT